MDFELEEHQCEEIPHIQPSMNLRILVKNDGTEVLQREMIYSYYWAARTEVHWRDVPKVRENKGCCNER